VKNLGHVNVALEFPRSPRAVNLRRTGYSYAEQRVSGSSRDRIVSTKSDWIATSKDSKKIICRTEFPNRAVPAEHSKKKKSILGLVFNLSSLQREFHFKLKPISTHCSNKHSLCST
jgi:hypothetical protein